ncbi:hypothetical protein Ciccas_000045 [Cichlidogyrus casuarinus]|uniref:Uncharacterized protein n=1 Tax=Cichlidogyrus casuarinus TaxID=1844966 RepID=A0ABD2QP75_9PLAT
MTSASGEEQNEAELFEVSRLWCVEGKLEEIKKFLETNHKTMLLEPNKHGIYCAHHAAGFGQVKILELLVQEFGAEKIVNVTDNDGWKPLHYAVRRKATKEDEIKLFGIRVVKGSVYGPSEVRPNSNFQKSNGHPTVKYLMEQMQDLEKVTQLKDHKKLQTEFVNALKRAIIHENYDAVSEIIKHFNSDTMSLLNNKDESQNGWTLLHIAAFYGFEEIVTELLQAEANMEILDNKKWTPGVKLTEGKNYNDTCLHLTCKIEDEKLFNLIFDKDVTALNKRNRLGQSPLHYAAIYDRNVIAEQLIKKGANLELRDYNKQTPLFLAVECNSTKTLKVLLNNNASFKTLDMSLKTCVFVAVEKNRPEALEILLKHFKKCLKTEDFSTLVNKGDNNNRTPLHIAAEMGGVETVKVLLDSEEINPLARDYQRDTALHLAAQNGHLK